MSKLAFVAKAKQLGLYWYLYLSETESWLFSISASVCLLFCLFFLLWKLDLEIEILFAVWILSLVGMGVFQCLYFYASFFFFFSLCVFFAFPSGGGRCIYMWEHQETQSIPSQPQPSLTSLFTGHVSFKTSFNANYLQLIGTICCYTC